MDGSRADVEGEPAAGSESPAATNGVSGDGSAVVRGGACRATATSHHVAPVTHYMTHTSTAFYSLSTCGRDVRPHLAASAYVLNTYS